MPDLLTFVVLTLATYRIGRFAILDSMIDQPRIDFHSWLTDPDKISVVRLKIAELITCPYCLTVWIAAAVTAFWSLVVAGEWVGWAFVLLWPAVAAGSLVWWAYIDSED